MCEGSVTLSIFFSVNIIVWPLPMLDPALVVGVVSILNLTTSFSSEHEGCTVRSASLSPSWLRISSLPGNKLFYNICKFKLQLRLYNSVSNLGFEIHLQVTTCPYARKNPLHVWIGNKTYA